MSSILVKEEENQPALLSPISLHLEDADGGEKKIKERKKHKPNLKNRKNGNPDTIGFNRISKCIGICRICNNTADHSNHESNILHKLSVPDVYIYISDIGD